MNKYDKWQKLNESLGFPLGVRSASSLGAIGGFTAYEESKKKKMDIGDEIEADEPEEDSDDDGDEPKGKKLPPWLQKKGHDEPDGDEGGEGCCSCHSKGDEHKPFCKRAKKNLKKKSKKQMQAEMFRPYEDCQYTQMPEVGSDEYRDAFFKSVEGHMGAPGKRHWSGVDLGEEVLFQPENDQMPSPNPTPGQVGYAPTGRVGGDLGTTATEKPAWEQQWKPIADEMQGLIDQWDTFQSRLK